jgi:hypothetical protein
MMPSPWVAPYAPASTWTSSFDAWAGRSRPLSWSGRKLAVPTIQSAGERGSSFFRKGLDPDVVVLQNPLGALDDLSRRPDADDLVGLGW